MDTSKSETGSIYPHVISLNASPRTSQSEILNDFTEHWSTGAPSYRLGALKFRTDNFLGFSDQHKFSLSPEDEMTVSLVAKEMQSSTCTIKNPISLAFPINWA